jgi:phage terminase large subunit
MADLCFNFTDRQMEGLEILSRPGVEVLGFGGAKGGGKSRFIRDYQKMRRLKYPGTSGLIVRKTLGELERNHIRPLRKELPEAVYDYRDDKHLFRFKNGSYLELAYIDMEKDLERLQGGEYDDICLDEAQMHPKRVFSEMRSCLRHASSVAGADGEIVPKMILTWNWGNIGHAWLKRMFWRRWMQKTGDKLRDEENLADKWDLETHWDDGERPEQFAFLQAFWHDNPFLDKGYIDRLNALPEALRKAYRDGDPDIFEGQFFPEFGPHLREMPFVIHPHEARLYGSLDYGDGDGEHGGKTSFGLWQIDDRGKPHRLFTYYQGGGTPETHARAIVAEIRSFPWTSGVMPSMTVADPAVFIKRKLDESHVFSVADVFAQFGLPLTPANNNRVNGWRVCRDMFSVGIDGQPNSFYWDGYNAEYEGFIPTLVYAKGNKSDAQKGGDDHVCDETRYFMVHAMGFRVAALTRALTANQETMEDVLVELQKSGRIGEVGI